MCPLTRILADLASRGFLPDDEEAWERWIGGGFLNLKESEWPVGEEVGAHPVGCACTSVQEDKNEELFDCPQEHFLDALGERVSEWSKLVRIIACCFEFARKSRGGRTSSEFSQHSSSPLASRMTVAETPKAESVIFQYVQRRAFPRESSGLTPKRDSPLASLNPFRQKDTGLLRVGGRLSKSDMSESAKHPVLLPAKDKLVRLMVKEAHQRDLHAPPRSVLHELRKKVWIVNGLSVVKKMCRECLHCRRMLARPSGQKMGDLPKARITVGHCFQSVGLDFMGPFRVKVRRAVEKRWVCIFTCMKVRAVHLELVPDLTTSSFINCLERFVSTRPGPVEDIFCDNGTNFRGAERELKAAVKQFNQAVASSNPARADFMKNISWHFQPPSAPTWGGVFERLVGMTKRVFKGMSASEPYNEDVFRTVLSKAIGIMNRRPLTEITTDPDDFRALSPNDFLNPLTNDLRFQEVIPPSMVKVQRPSVRIWKQSRDRQFQFWVRWMREYVALLQTREKWQRPVPNLKVGELVYVVDDMNPRTSWPLARIEQVFPGEDGLVCRVQVRMPLGRSLIRDRQKIVQLEVQGDHSSTSASPDISASTSASPDISASTSASPDISASTSASPDISASTSSSTDFVAPDGEVEQVTEEEILKGLRRSSRIAAKAASIYD